MTAKAGTKIFIFSPDKILLFHRDNIPTIPSPDCWHFIGGGIEAGETPEQGLVREVKEEVSFDLNDYQLLAKTTGNLGQDLYIYITFVSKDEESKFQHGAGEGQEIGWFTLDEALTLKLTPNTRFLLTEYRQLFEKMMITKKIVDINFPIPKAPYVN